MRRNLLLPLAACLATSVAAAPRPRFERVPAEVQGDGATVERLEVAPARGTLRVDASAGTVRAQQVGEGTLSVEWVAPRVAEPLEVTFTARDGKPARVVAVARVRVLPPELPARSVEGPLGMAAPRMLSGGPPAPIDVVAGEEALTLLVSAGMGGAFAAEGERRRATFTPPTEAYPRPVIAAVTDGRGELRDWTVLALDGLGEVEAVTEPNALVRFEIAGEQFGPVRTDAHGRARMKVRAPPGVEFATAVVADRVGNVRRTQIPLGAPTQPSVLAVCAAERGRLVLLAIDGAGRPAHGARFALEASGGTVGEPEQLGPGHYEAAVVPAEAPARLVVQAAWQTPSAAISVCSFPVAPARVVPPPVVKPPPMAAAPPSVHRWAGTPRVGYAFTAGRLSAPVVLLELGWRPAELPSLSLGVEGGYGTSWGQYLDATGTEPFSSRTWLAPLHARATWRPLAWTVSPYLAATAGVTLAGASTHSARTGTVRSTRVLPSGGAAVGVEWRLGPGALVGEVGYLRGFVVDAAPSPALNGWLFSAGYRLER